MYLARNFCPLSLTRERARVRVVLQPWSPSPQPSPPRGEGEKEARNSVLVLSSQEQGKHCRHANRKIVPRS
jgi:hypothetical protein